MGRDGLEGPADLDQPGVPDPVALTSFAEAKDRDLYLLARANPPMAILEASRRVEAELRRRLSAIRVEIPQQGLGGAGPAGESAPTDQRGHPKVDRRTGGPTQPGCACSPARVGRGGAGVFSSRRGHAVRHHRHRLRSSHWPCRRVTVQNWLESIAQNLVAELLFLLLLLALGWLLYRATHRRPLLSFFGIRGSKLAF